VAGSGACAIGAPCNSNFCHAHLFFSPYSLINRKIQSPLLLACLIGFQYAVKFARMQAETNLDFQCLLRQER
jgi:hypothetical protein